MNEHELKCLRCGVDMAFQRRASLREVDGDWFVAEFRLDVDLYVCPKCGKLEFFKPGIRGGGGTDSTGYYRPGIGPDVKCSLCGKEHPSDDPYCPLCGTPTPKPRKCEWCGAELAGSEERCPQCGAGLTKK